MKNLYFFLFFLCLSVNFALKGFSEEANAKVLADSAKESIQKSQDDTSESPSNQESLASKESKEESLVEEEVEDQEDSADLEVVGPPKIDTDEAFESMDFKGSFFRMIIALILVLALAFVILNYVVPKLARRRFKITKSDIRVLERIPLDAKKHLYVIQVEEKRILISSTDHYVGLITELSPHEEEQDS